MGEAVAAPTERYPPMVESRMIAELANLSAGRIMAKSQVAVLLDKERLAHSSLEYVEELCQASDAPSVGRHQPAEPEPSDTPVSDNEFAALAYLLFGADDCPELVERYVFGGDGKRSLEDAAVEPPLFWSDTAFAAADPAIRTDLARGMIGSGFAYAKANRKEALGSLPPPPLVETLRQRGIPEWVAQELTAMSLKGAPLAPTEELGRRLFWAVRRGPETTQLAEGLRRELPSNATHVILVPWMDSGGVERVALWHARAIEESGGRCIMIGTDAPKYGWVNLLPASCTFISLSAVQDRLGLSGRLSSDNCAAALGATLASTPFRVLHIINSYVGTRMLRLPIDWRDRRVFYALYGVGTDSAGLESGYWFSARELLSVDLFLSDNITVPRARAEAFGLTPERFHGLKYPVKVGMKFARNGARDSSKPRILWASRLDPEKQPAMVFKIAERLPHVEFHMFGRGVMSDGRLPDPPANVTLRGGFDGWESLPRESFDGFLFTSRGDGEGMPNIILEAMGSGLPIVASRVGAVEEVLDQTRGWLIDDVQDANAFADAIAEMIADPAEAGRRARAALLRVARDRSFKNFMKSLDEIFYL
jgi:glycosyltransferase involved in cell wall biosynthesis